MTVTHQDPNPTITTFVLGEFQTNCFVVTTPGETGCWIVDCGFEPEPMLEWITERSLRPVALLLAAKKGILH